MASPPSRGAIHKSPANANAMRVLLKAGFCSNSGFSCAKPATTPTSRHIKVGIIFFKVISSETSHVVTNLFVKLLSRDEYIRHYVDRFQLFRASQRDMKSSHGRTKVRPTFNYRFRSRRVSSSTTLAGAASEISEPVCGTGNCADGRDSYNRFAGEG